VRLRGIHVPGAAVYPPAFAAAVLINQFTSSSAPVEALVRPLAVVVLGCLAVQAIVTLVLGSADRAGYVCAVAVGLILGITGLTLLLSPGSRSSSSSRSETAGRRIACRGDRRPGS
jgi:hypothetical protein